MSVGQERMIVNCGSAIEPEATWHMVQRMTAAHSTLSVEDRNSSEILNDGGFGRSAQIIAYSRQDTETELCFEASHDGYQQVFELEHSRKVEVLRNKEGVRGSEIISTSGEFGFAVRFHLHPAAAVSLAQGGSSALIKLKKGGGWRLSASGVDMQIEDSIYLGSGKPKRTSQIVLTGSTNKGSIAVEWSIEPMS